MSEKTQEGCGKLFIILNNTLKQNVTDFSFRSSPQKQPVLAEKIGVKYSELILCKDEPQPSSTEQDLSYQGLCALQTYSTPCCYPPIPVSGTPTPQNTISFECIQNATRARTTSNTDLSSYSKILFSQNPRVSPTPLQSTSYLPSSHWQHSAVSVSDAKLPPGGDGELSVSLQDRVARFWSPLSQTDELKSVSDLLRQHQSPVSVCDFSIVFHSSHRAETTSSQNPLSQSHYSSVPSLQLNTTHRPDALSDTLTTLYSPVPDLPPPIFVDFSYCRLDCEPWIPPPQCLVSCQGNKAWWRVLSHPGQGDSGCCMVGT